MTRFISATYHPKLKAAEFIADDGRHLIRSGGSLPWRTHNIGNLVSPVINGAPAPKKTRGYIGFAKPADSNHHFFIFPDEETGRTQLKASLLRLHKDKSLDQLVAAYAPEHDGNDTDGYTRKLSQLTGIDADCIVKDMSDSQLESLIDGIARLEGYHANTDTRKEIWVNISSIQATDGSRPIAGEEIVLRSNGKETTLKSNESGQFGVIPHGGEPVDVLHKTVDGKLKKVGTLPPDKSQNWNLLTKISEFFGSTAPVKPPADTPQKRQPTQYIVQPGDSLSKIAKRFDTTVASIKQANRLKTDAIWPGQVLGIHGTAPKSASDLPKKAPNHSKETDIGLSRERKTAQPSSVASATPARSKRGTGEPIALIQPEDGRAPWMKYAIDEAKRHKGAKEATIEKAVNYPLEVKTGQKTMVGDADPKKEQHPWCAAFANWCLMKAGYPIDNPSFYDHTAAKGRAHGFFEVSGPRDPKTKSVSRIRNPLFAKLDRPIYGAIAMVTNKSGHGHHVGFVYADQGNGALVLLGGNQADQINFSPFLIKGKKDHLLFFVPSAYKVQESDYKLINSDAEALNKTFGIQTNKKTAGGTL